MENVYIKIFVLGKWHFYIGTSTNGVVYFSDKKAEGKIVKSIDCIELFASIRKYFASLNPPAEIQLKKQNV